MTQRRDILSRTGFSPLTGGRNLNFFTCSLEINFTPIISIILLDAKRSANEKYHCKHLQKMSKNLLVVFQVAWKNDQEKTDSSLFLEITPN